MKNLSTFSSNKISLEEQACIKGGIRFTTTDKDVYKAKKKELKNAGITILEKEKVKCPVTGIKTYCIEW